jgi:hypothetical protein
MSPGDPKRENPELLEQNGVSEGIEALPQRVDRYGKAKKGALDIGEYMATMPTYAKQTKRLLSCGDYLVFNHYWTVDKVKLHGASLCCMHLLCPLCAIRRGAKALGAYMDRWEVIKAQKPHLRPFLVTLTVKDGEDLEERFKHLQKSQVELGCANIVGADLRWMVSPVRSGRTSSSGAKTRVCGIPICT